ncbi:hypothetical protein B6D16_11325 [Gilliamella apicola]|uniref:PAAR domain-containing protein n=1 Tax=Gilliamella apicola TaxID=1196095 RepID=UPI000A3583A3|nr:PAAR domain-containing protein [Gilliamella apicola]OTP96977.1 hypothetical protein B6D05_02330 [Gilliamella apicola]OTQ14851.1 hypothetical protein B6D16_11325 [Gilliamella apicola]OTQ17108.1 hypothetical protein B6D15_08495 [Gilliamella apicola]OTQ24880.1 hypothetical protein B6D04_04285 [Gilliamella apicola]
MSKQIAIIGDMTTTGGRIISGSGDSFNANQSIACIGDYSSCPKCQSTGKIIEGTYNFIVAGKPAAYDGCIVACKCSPIGCNKIIALESTIFVGVEKENNSLTSIINTSIIQNNINENLNNDATKEGQQEIEAYLFTVRDAKFGFGDHSALYINFNEEDKYPLIFDPNGGYMRQYRGQAEAFYDDGDFPFSIEEYKKFHEVDGDYVNLTKITLTRQQAINIEQRVINGDYATGILPYCASAVSSVLVEYGLEELYLFPGSLEDAVKEIEEKKGLSNENH